MAELAVFDTNVWISGLLWRGAPYQCLLLARAKVVQPVYCIEMLAELSRKLREPFGFGENELAAVLYDYKKISRRIEIVSAQGFVPNDPDDDKFVACALAADAKLVVTSDKHLLALGSCEGVEMLRPVDFLARVLLDL